MRANKQYDPIKQKFIDADEINVVITADIILIGKFVVEMISICLARRAATYCMQL